MDVSAVLGGGVEEVGGGVEEAGGDVEEAGGDVGGGGVRDVGCGVGGVGSGAEESSGDFGVGSVGSGGCVGGIGKEERGVIEERSGDVGSSGCDIGGIGCTVGGRCGDVGGGSDGVCGCVAEVGGGSCGSDVGSGGNSGIGGCGSDGSGGGLAVESEAPLVFCVGVVASDAPLDVSSEGGVKGRAGPSGLGYRSKGVAVLGTNWRGRSGMRRIGRLATGSGGVSSADISLHAIDLDMWLLAARISVKLASQPLQRKTIVVLCSFLRCLTRLLWSL